MQNISCDNPFNGLPYIFVYTKAQKKIGTGMQFFATHKLLIELPCYSLRFFPLPIRECGCCDIDGNLGTYFLFIRDEVRECWEGRYIFLFFCLFRWGGILKVCGKKTAMKEDGGRGYKKGRLGGEGNGRCWQR